MDLHLFFNYLIYYLLVGVPTAIVIAQRITKMINTTTGKKIGYLFSFWLFWPYFLVRMVWSKINLAPCVYCGQQIKKDPRQIAKHLDECPNFIVKKQSKK